MPLLTTVAAVAAAAIATIYGTLKLVKWSLNAEEPDVRNRHVGHLYNVLKATLAVVLVIEFGGAVGAWFYDAWHVMTTALTSIV